MTLTMNLLLIIHFLCNQVRRLAFQLAREHGCQYPAVWATREMAGTGWMTNFMKRNPVLSLRRPQATSLSRATSFNPVNVGKFFENLSKVPYNYLYAYDVVLVLF